MFLKLFIFSFTPSITTGFRSKIILEVGSRVRNHHFIFLKKKKNTATMEGSIWRRLPTHLFNYSIFDNTVRFLHTQSMQNPATSVPCWVFTSIHEAPLFFCVWPVCYPTMIPHKKNSSYWTEVSYRYNNSQRHKLQYNTWYISYHNTTVLSSGHIDHAMRWSAPNRACAAPCTVWRTGTHRTIVFLPHESRVKRLFQWRISFSNKKNKPTIVVHTQRKPTAGPYVNHWY